MEEILKKLVAFHTTADDVQSIHQALDFIATFVTQRGMHVERFEAEGHESLVATIRPGHKTPKVMLTAHLDVLPAADEFFTLRQLDGKLYGRGTLDMKYAIASYLQLIDDLQDNLADYDFALMITSDEETGGNYGTRLLLEEGYRPQVCVLPDGGDDWQIQTASKGFYYLQLRKYGTPAHGSRPWLGDNAIVPIAEAITEIRALFGEPTPESPTLNIGTIAGGGGVNQVADYAEVSLDIRAWSEKQKQGLLAGIRVICDNHTIELNILLDGLATKFDLRHPLIAPFATAITTVTGKTVTGSRTLGSNDTRFFADFDIPCISVYPTGAGHHGPEEWIDQKSFHQFRLVLRQYLDAVAAVRAD